MHVEVGGLNIAFERAGTGPVVALAHGFVGDARSTWGSQNRERSPTSSRATPTAWPGSSGHCGSSERTWSGSPSAGLWCSQRSTGTAGSRPRSPS